MILNCLIGFFVPTSSRILDGFLAVGIFLFGLCIGSFLNCYIYRLEEGKSMKGRSFCPHCKHALSWLDLFPVFSFVFLGGKCRYCHKKISWRYPLVELLTGIIFALVFWHLGFGLTLVFWLYFSAVLIIIFVYDLKHYIIPDKVLFPAIAIAIIFQLIDFTNFLNYFLAAVVASGFFLLIFLISRGKAMGFGDVKLAILMGFLLGLPKVLAALFFAFFLGAVIGVALMIGRKKSLKSEIPFGPFLITGTFIAMLYGSQIIQWYTNFFQI